MSRRQFVVLDRDGTLIVEKHYLADPEQVELLPGVVSGLRRLLGLQLGLVILTNQAGIGRRFFDKDQLDLIHDRLLGMLDTSGIQVDGIYYCPHLPEEGCDCRKPNPGLLKSAASDLDFEPRDAFVIGDKPCDIELGKALGATTFLVRTGYGSVFADDPSIAADYVVDDLCEAASIIERIHASLLAGERTQRENSKL
jgi:D-glycero-D-manno-heptose 1,7-bisphosphate phosphatase